MFQYRLPVVITRELLDKALKALPGHAFKLFVFLWAEIWEFTDEGVGHPWLGLDEATEKLSLEAEVVVEALIYLRQSGWIDMLALARPFANDRIYIAWDIDLYYEEPDTESLARDEERAEEWEKAEGTILAGIEWKQDGLSGKPRKNSRFYSQHFREMRPAVLERDKHQCTECGSSENLHVHHISYDNQGSETLADLVTLCGSCHAKMPKNRRNAVC